MYTMNFVVVDITFFLEFLYNIIIYNIILNYLFFFLSIIFDINFAYTIVCYI